MKNLMKIVLVMGILAVLSSSAQANLLLHWAFDEAAGATQAEDTGYLGIYDGALVGTPVFGETGVAGGAAKFNVSDGADYIRLANTPAITQLTTFSLSFWLKADSTQTAHQFPVSYGASRTMDGVDNVECGWEMFYRSGTTSEGGVLNYRMGWWRVDASYPDGVTDWTINPTTSLARDNQWHQLALTVEYQELGTLAEYPLGSGKFYQYYKVTRTNYLDGVSLGDSLVGVDYLPLIRTDIPLTAGARVESTTDGVDDVTYGIKGYLDDFQLYDEALSAADIAYMYANPGAVVPEPATLVLLALGGVAFLRRRHA